MLIVVRSQNLGSLKHAAFDNPPFNALYQNIVTASRGGLDILGNAGYDLASGPVARKRGGVWTPDRTFPNQYAFKSATAGGGLRPVLVVPLPPR